jgi:hypothetical protein
VDPANRHPCEAKLPRRAGKLVAATARKSRGILRTIHLLHQSPPMDKHTPAPRCTAKSNGGPECQAIASTAERARDAARAAAAPIGAKRLRKAGRLVAETLRAKNKALLDS